MNLLDSRDYIWMKNNHIIQFINTKENPVDEIDHELIERKIYQKPKNFKGIVGHVLIIGKSNRQILA